MKIKSEQNITGLLEFRKTEFQNALLCVRIEFVKRRITDMKWNKYRMKTTTEAVDLISYTLGEMGIEGIEIEDKIPLSDLAQPQG